MKKVAVIAESTRYFESQEEARAYAIKLLEAGLTFLEIINKEDC